MSIPEVTLGGKAPALVLALAMLGMGPTAASAQPAHAINRAQGAPVPPARPREGTSRLDRRPVAPAVRVGEPTLKASSRVANRLQNRLETRVRGRLDGLESVSRAPRTPVRVVDEARD